MGLLWVEMDDYYTNGNYYCGLRKTPSKGESAYLARKSGIAPRWASIAASSCKESFSSSDGGVVTSPR